MRIFPLSMGLGMLITLALGLLGSFSFSGNAYISAGAISAGIFGMDWLMLAFNIVAWIVVVYAVLFVVERVRR